VESSGWTSQQPIGWRSYDGVAEVYERLAVPWFTPIVHDLLAAVSPQPGARLLDVGCGTGLATGSAASIVGAGGVAVGVDPSVGMLAVARARRHVDVCAGMAPGLPFADGSFDTVVANLAISHFPDLAAGLADVARVLRAGGRLGCTAWAEVEPAHDHNQQAVASTVVDVAITAAGLDASPAGAAVPWEDHLRNADHLADALTSAGFTAITLTKRTYRRTFTVDDYLSGWGSRTRYLRSIASNREWEQFHHQARTELRTRFGDHISSVNHTWMAVADKPSCG
jgi:ubiquinone/menaquinone biosynthesis C-methylase UbiE